MPNKQTINLEVQLDVKDAKSQAQELSRSIESTLNSNKGTSSSRLRKVMQGLESVQRQVEAINNAIKTTSDNNIQQISQRAAESEIRFREADKAVQDYVQHLREIGKGNIVKKFESVGGGLGGADLLDKNYFGKNRTAEISEIIKKLKELTSASWEAKRTMLASQADKFFATQPGFADNVLEGESGQKIAKAFQDATDKGEILLLKYNELIEKDKELSGEVGGGKKASSFSKGNFYFARTIINDLNRGLDKVISKVKKFTSHLANAAKRMFQLKKDSKSTTGTLNDGFKHALRNIMRYGLGVRSLYFLFRRLRGYIKEAFQEMAKAFPEVNQQMSRAVTALNQMKGSLGTAFQPLLNVLIPLLEKVAALVVKIATALGSLFAMLTGQKVLYNAVATQVDYAASLDKTGASAKKAKKELEGYLSPIDEINKFQSKQDDSGGGAGGGGVTYEEVPLPDYAQKLKAFIDKLLNPMKKAWEKMGDFVKKSWKYAMDEVLKLGKSVARDFWKVWAEDATALVFQNILETIGWIGQAVGNLAKRFREAWDENNTGLNILRAIRNLILTVTNHVRNMAKATAEWADSLNLSPLLTKLEGWLRSMRPVIDSIAGILSDFYTQVLLPLGKWTLEKGLPELLQVFTDFNNKVDWESLRANLSDFWDHLEPFAERVGEGLIAFIGDLSDKLAEFMNSEKFVDFLTKVEEWMDSVSAEDIENTLGKLAETLPALAIGFTVLKGAMSGLSSLMPVVGMIGNLKAAFGAGGAAAGGGAAATEGLAGAATAAAEGVGELDLTLANLASSTGTAVATEGELDLTLASLCSNASGAEGAIGGTEAAVGGLGASFGAAAGAVAVLVGAFVTLWNTSESFKASITAILHDLGGAFKEFFGDTGSELGEFVADIKEGFKEIWSGIKSYFKGIKDDFKAFVDFVKPVWTSFCKFLSPIFTNAFKMVSETLKGTFTILKGALQVFVGVFTGNWQKAWDGMVNIFKGCVNVIASTFEGLVNNLVGIANGFIGGVNSISIAGHSANIPLIPRVSVPRLAQGAVIPPNKEFMAVLGDQKNGTNIETPLETMVEAFNRAMANNGGGRTEINFLLPDRRKVAQYVLEGGRVIQTSTGSNPFQLA